MSVITRFAPSPTGFLHIGNIRTALLNWLLAKRDGGRFMLRIDDTDTARSEDRYAKAIRADLAWLGLAPDGEERQSMRLGLYDQAAARLERSARLYPCWETPRELDLMRKVQLGRGLPPIYDRSALELSDAAKQARLEAGDKPHWRFLLDHHEPIRWDDAVRGEQSFQASALSDPVVRRADGSWLYMLPSVVDDIAMGITDVLRGEDHVTNTAVQIQMFTALGATPPRFAHVALLTGSEGKLSKRLGSLHCAELRERDIEPQALLALLARLGTSQAIEPEPSLDRLVGTFDLAAFGRAPAKFDMADLERLNAAIVHQLDFDAVADRLPPAMDAEAWLAIRPNLAKVGEAQDWWQVIRGPVEHPRFDNEARSFLATAHRLLSWGEDPWGELTRSLAAATGRKGKALFLPLRQALTGRDHGPEMARLLPLIGEEQARERLSRAAG